MKGVSPAGAPGNVAATERRRARCQVRETLNCVSESAPVRGGADAGRSVLSSGNRLRSGCGRRTRCNHRFTRIRSNPHNTPSTQTPTPNSAGLVVPCSITEASAMMGAMCASACPVTDDEAGGAASGSAWVAIHAPTTSSSARATLVMILVISSRSLKVTALCVRAAEIIVSSLSSRRQQVTAPGSRPSSARPLARRWLTCRGQAQDGGPRGHRWR